jgi:ectoine hydroxylase-related dioxygenase (phytanoyl-CoA dioxygenase family)
MDIGADLGGLTIAPGSHKWGPLHDDDAPPLYEIPQGRIDDSAWRRSDYKVGDVLIFHNLVVHAALDNVSEMLRLSIDVRAVPASSPQPIVGRVVDFLDETLTVDTRNGVRRVQMNGDTYVRGIGNARLRREEWDTVLRSGNEIIAALDDDGAPTVVRSGV